MIDVGIARTTIYSEINNLTLPHWLDTLSQISTAKEHKFGFPPKDNRFLPNPLPSLNVKKCFFHRISRNLAILDLGLSDSWGSQPQWFFYSGWREREIPTKAVFALFLLANSSNDAAGGFRGISQFCADEPPYEKPIPYRRQDESDALLYEYTRWLGHSDRFCTPACLFVRTVNAS